MSTWSPRSCCHRTFPTAFDCERFDSLAQMNSKHTSTHKHTHAHAHTYTRTRRLILSHLSCLLAAGPRAAVLVLPLPGWAVCVTTEQQPPVLGLPQEPVSVLPPHGHERHALHWCAMCMCLRSDHACVHTLLPHRLPPPGPLLGLHDRWLCSLPLPICRRSTAVSFVAGAAN